MTLILLKSILMKRFVISDKQKPKGVDSFQMMLLAYTKWIMILTSYLLI